MLQYFLILFWFSLRTGGIIHVTHFNLGINLGFAVKRWPEPQAWAKFIREELELDFVQFTYDLLDPWWPEDVIREMAAEIRQVSQDWGITIHSAFVGLANYTYNGLLHPKPAGRATMLEWWKRAIRVAALLGAREMGGPLGGMSYSDAGDPNKVKERYETVLDTVSLLSKLAHEAGLGAFLIEPTPLKREFPHTPEQAKKMLADLAGRTKTPIKFVLDIGHAGYQPLYGSSAGCQPWLDLIHDQVGMFHLQNTDFHSDSHWGWPEERGKLNLDTYWKEIIRNNLENIPVVLEVFYPYEMDDDQVRANIISSVKYIKNSLLAV